MRRVPKARPTESRPLCRASFHTRRSRFAAAPLDLFGSKPLLDVRNQIFGERVRERNRPHPIGILCQTGKHEEEYVKYFEARRIQLGRDAQSNPDMLLFDSF
jgi:hypothetical protein